MLKNHPWNGWMKWDEYFRLGTNGTHYRNHGETVAVHLRSWMKWSFMETFPGGFILVNLASNGIFTKPMNWGTNSRRWISWGDTVDFSFPYQDHCGGFRWSKVRPDIGGQWMARIQAHAGCFLNFTSRFEGRVDLEWQGFLKIMFVVFFRMFFWEGNIDAKAWLWHQSALCTFEPPNSLWPSTIYFEHLYRIWA